VIDEWLKFVEAKVSRGQQGEQSEKEGECEDAVKLADGDSGRGTR